MANPQLGAAAPRFEGTVQRTKNRLVAVPAAIQRKLGLVRRPDNDILLVSIRKPGVGRWNHHYVKLTRDGEFGIPADVTHVRPGDAIEVKVHAVFSGTPKRTGGARLLLALAGQRRRGWRRDGSTTLDEHLAREARG